MLSKVIERHVHSQLCNYLTEYSILYQQQFGFRRERSITTALLKFVDDLLENMDSNKVTGVIYLDLKKSVWYFGTPDPRQEAEIDWIYRLLIAMVPILFGE